MGPQGIMPNFPRLWLKAGSALHFLPSHWEGRALSTTATRPHWKSRLKIDKIGKILSAKCQFWMALRFLLAPSSPPFDCPRHLDSRTATRRLSESYRNSLTLRSTYLLEGLFTTRTPHSTASALGGDPRRTQIQPPHRPRLWTSCSKSPGPVRLFQLRASRMRLFP